MARKRPEKGGSGRVDPLGYGVGYRVKELSRQTCLLLSLPGLRIDVCGTASVGGKPAVPFSQEHRVLRESATVKRPQRTFPVRGQSTTRNGQKPFPGHRNPPLLRGSCSATSTSKSVTGKLRERRHCRPPAAVRLARLAFKGPRTDRAPDEPAR